MNILVFQVRRFNKVNVARFDFALFFFKRTWNISLFWRCNFQNSARIGHFSFIAGNVVKGQSNICLPRTATSFNPALNLVLKKIIIIKMKSYQWGYWVVVSHLQVGHRTEIQGFVARNDV